MELQAWIAAASLLIATSAFIFSALVRRNIDRNAELRSWQRVVVYSIIEEDGPISFKDIRSKYLQKAQQFLEKSISKIELHDDNLRRILLDIQSEEVIGKKEDGDYTLQYKPIVETWAREFLQDEMLKKKLKPQIIKIVEKEPGVHTVDTLARKLHELNLSVSFENLDIILEDLLPYRSLKKNEEGKFEIS